MDNNPLEYISAFRKVNSVIVRGRYYSRIKLDKMLGDAKKRKEEVDKER